MGGSPATEQLVGGIESVDLAGKNSSVSPQESKNAITSLEGGDTSFNLDNSSISGDNNDGDGDTVGYSSYRRAKATQRMCLRQQP
jgi:hypothetical protein